MLWLAGLMGVTAVGAAVFMDFGSVVENDEDDGGDQADRVPASSERPMIEIASPDAVNATLSTITDFIPSDDSLLCIWDDSASQGEPPALRIAGDPAHAGQLQVWLGEEIVAQVSGRDALETADIALMPLSSAIALELVSAQGQPAQ